MIEVILDFETASGCDLKEAGAWRYAEDVTTEILCVSHTGPYGLPSKICTWKPGDDTDYLTKLANDPDVLFVAHNAGFEKAIWRNIMVPIYGLPNVPNERWDDTQAVCAMKALPLDLDRSTLHLRLAQHKDKEGSAFTKKLSKPNRKGYYDRSEQSLYRVYAYCEQDVRAELELWKRLGPLPPSERQVWLLDQKINERGVRLDLPFIAAAQQVVDRAIPPLAEEFSQITGGLKPTQVTKFRDWIGEQGVWIDSLGKETVATLLGEESEDDTEGDENAVDIGGYSLPDSVRRALVIRGLVGSASIKKLKRMRTCVGSDGRARGLLQYHGASPGRWAGRLLQPQNFPRGTVKDENGNKFDPEHLVSAIMTGCPTEVEIAIGPPVESVVSSLRHAIIAAPGRTLLSGDFAGVEARFVLAVAGQYDKTELMAAGMDAYCDMAGLVYKRAITKKDEAERHIGKGAVLGLGFNLGYKKFKAKVAQKESEDFCKEVVRIYREDWAPMVPQLWYGLNDAAMNAVYGRQGSTVSHNVEYKMEDRWLTARLPSGRKLWYFNPVRVNRAMPWDETIVRPSWTYQQMKMGQFKTIDAFGGLLTENVIQALARDLMVAAMFRLEENGFPIILTVHDEIVCEPLKEDADEKAFQEIMSEVPDWAKKIKVPVAVETWKGDRYRK